MQICIVDHVPKEKARLEISALPMTFTAMGHHLLSKILHWTESQEAEVPPLVCCGLTLLAWFRRDALLSPDPVTRKCGRSDLCTGVPR